MVESLLSDMLKTAIMSLVISKAVKAVGEHDMSQIISFSGYMAIGVDAWQVGKIAIKWINAVGDKIEHFKLTDLW